MPIKTFTLVNGLMIKLTVAAHIFMQTELNILESGTWTSNKERVMKPGQMEPAIREIIMKAKSMGSENSTGLMALLTRENSRIIIFMEKDFINGATADLMMAIGSSIKCMAKEFSSGKTEESTKVNTMMIRNKV